MVQASFYCWSGETVEHPVYSLHFKWGSALMLTSTSETDESWMVSEPLREKEEDSEFSFIAFSSFVEWRPRVCLYCPCLISLVVSRFTFTMFPIAGAHGVKYFTVHSIWASAHLYFLPLQNLYCNRIIDLPCGQLSLLTESLLLLHGRHLLLYPVGPFCHMLDQMASLFLTLSPLLFLLPLSGHGLLSLSLWLD